MRIGWSSECVVRRCSVLLVCNKISSSAWAKKGLIAPIVQIPSESLHFIDEGGFSLLRNRKDFRNMPCDMKPVELPTRDLQSLSVPATVGNLGPIPSNVDEDEMDIL